MIGYRGVKFDDTGQNTLASTFLIQLQGKQYVSVWPDSQATGKLELPMKGWHVAKIDRTARRSRRLPAAPHPSAASIHETNSDPRSS